MPEPTLSDRLVTAAERAMPVEISNRRDAAAAIAVAVLLELHDSLRPAPQDSERTHG